jgi:hypothetical protein
VKELVKGKLYEVEVGDMFAEEERDVLVEVQLPALAAATTSGSTSGSADPAEMILQYNIRYVDVIEGSMQGRELPPTPVDAAVLPATAATTATDEGAGADEGEAAAASAGAGDGATVRTRTAEVQVDGVSDDGDDSMILVDTYTLTADQLAAQFARSGAGASESIVLVSRPTESDVALLDEGVGVGDSANVSVHITRQWARIHTAEAMDAARKVADAGKYTEGQKVLDEALLEVQKAQKQVKAASAYASKGKAKSKNKNKSKDRGKGKEGAGAGTDDDALLANLCEQLTECRDDMKQAASNRSHWEREGKYRACNYAQGHHMQRSNCSKMSATKSAYRGKSKQMMCASSAVSSSVMAAKSKRGKSAPVSASSSSMGMGMWGGRRNSRTRAPLPPPAPSSAPSILQSNAPPMMQQQTMQPQMQMQMPPPPPPQLQVPMQQQQPQQPGMMSTIMESMRASWGSNSHLPTQRLSPRPSA